MATVTGQVKENIQENIKISQPKTSQKRSFVMNLFFFSDLMLVGKKIFSRLTTPNKAKGNKTLIEYSHASK